MKKEAELPDEATLKAIPPELEPLVERIGRPEIRRRLYRERVLRLKKGLGHGKGFFWLEHRIDLYAIIRFCIWCTGLWARAQRNYLDIRVEENVVRLAGLPSSFDGFRLLQVSDLHADLHPEFPERLGSLVADLEYDHLVVTGDFRTCTFGDHSGATAASIEILKKRRAPCHAILGNHDSIAKVQPMEAEGIPFLLNESAALTRGSDAIYLVGIDDPNYYGTANFDRAMAGVPSSACKILLSHAPQTYREAESRGFDLLLAGHTHGGQMCLPGGFVLVHDNTCPRRLLKGAWREGSLQGYTSRGAGATGLPARLNCPPEVTIHVLRCADKNDGS